MSAQLIVQINSVIVSYCFFLGFEIFDAESFIYKYRDLDPREKKPVSGCDLIRKPLFLLPKYIMIKLKFFAR